MHSFGRKLRRVILPGIAGRVSILVGFSIIAVLVAAASAILLADAMRQDLLQFRSRAAIITATANRLHDVLDRERHFVNALTNTADAAEFERMRDTVTQLVAEMRICLAGGADCAQPNGEFAGAIEADAAEVRQATDEVLRQAAERTGQMAGAGARFNQAADRLHRSIRAWQERDFDSLAGSFAALSARAGRAAAYVAGSMAALLLIGSAGFVLVLRALFRLMRLTSGMVRLASGDVDIEIPFRDARDEVGRLARALDVFRQTAQRLAASEATLRTVNARLDAALNNMSQGLVMFDAAMRLVVVNAQARQMFGVAADAALHGRTFDDLVDAAAARGMMTPDSAEEVKARMRTVIASGKRLTYTRDLRNGVSVAVLISPIPGGGWLTTFEDITERRSQEEQIAFLAHHDALTGLANRTLFLTELQRMLLASQGGLNCALLYIDLDHFKEVNDTLGHAAGDMLLRTIAARLRDITRASDLIARLGGDEFAIIAPNVSLAEAEKLARRVIATLSEPVMLGEQETTIGASIGLAVAPVDGIEPDDLIRKADLALYEAKAEGRGVYRHFEPSLGTRLQARQELERDLRLALARDEFELHYQPLVDLTTRAPLGFEALLRWRSPDRGLVGPAAFIPVAEDSGLIVPIGEWVIRRACADAASWPAHLSVSINVSAVQFKSESLVRVIGDALAESGLAPHRLELEITESTMLQENERTLRTLQELRALGVCIAVDDFGTGYSGLSYLRHFPFNRVKIDQSFVRGLGGQEGCEAIIRAMVGLGASLGIAIIAEGIETEAQFAQVRAEGCTLGQGYFFSRPVPATELAPLLLTASRGVALPPAAQPLVPVSS